MLRDGQVKVILKARHFSASARGHGGGPWGLSDYGGPLLKRPLGLALGELEVPAVPAGAPPSALGDDIPIGGEIDALDVPLVDVASALSPLLASTFGLAPGSMRSFLRIDDLTFDLLSPLGTGRPGAHLKDGDSFPAPAPPL